MKRAYHSGAENWKKKKHDDKKGQEQDYQKIGTMSANKQENELKVVSWNINGLKEKLNDMDKTRKLKTFFGSFDIVLLQETRMGHNKKIKEHATNDNVEGEDEENQASAESDKRGMEYMSTFLECDDEKEQSESSGESNEEGMEDMPIVSGSEDEEQSEESESEVFEEQEEDDADLQIIGYRIKVLKDQRCLEPGTREEDTMYMTYFNSRSRGVAILVKKTHNCLKAYCEGGDFAWVYIDIGGQKYTFVSVYYHRKKESDLMLRLLRSFLIHGPEAWTKSRLVIGGDFNTTLNPDLDLNSENPLHSTRRRTLNEFKRIMKLEDVWRAKNLEEIQYTYSCQRPMSRLDYVFMFEEDLQNVLKCHIHVHVLIQELSDHYPVVLSLTTKIIKN